jgi:transcriptional regulator with XRE-family HTH domain
MRLSKSDATVAIGQRLEEIRKNLGYSQRMMAEELDVTVQQYQKYIRGENALSADRINHLYRNTQIDVRYLITGEREEDNKTFTFVLSTYGGRNRQRFLDSMWVYLQKITGMDEDD